LETGHYREYDPTTGRWSREDPYGYGDGPNLYAYVGSNPINRRDPLGLQAEKPKPPQGDKKTPPKDGTGPFTNTKNAIIDVWTSCEKPKKRLYYKDTDFNPLTNREKWNRFRDDFSKECQKAAAPGMSNSTLCRVAVGFSATGFCSCCEEPCPAK
jgi:uncharacterized protein RhaS with RHS repeats